MAEDEKASDKTGDAEPEMLAEVKTGTPKLPSFWKRNPDLWFAQMEAQFHTCHVKSDNTKYFTVLAALDCDTLQPIADLVARPPKKHKYETIKKRLISMYADSQERQLRKLLNEMELGDRKPSQLLSEMKTLAGSQINKDVLKTLWLQQLPPYVQLILSASEALTLEKIDDVTDKLSEIHRNNPSTSGSISTVSRTSSLTGNIDEHHGSNKQSAKTVN
jgi:hypothetical protein